MPRQISFLQRLDFAFNRGKFHPVQLDIRRNTFSLNRTPGRGVVTRRGQLQGRLTAKRQYRLYRTLAERLGTDNDCTLVILKSTRNNLRGGSRTLIDQHHQRRTIDDIIRCRIETQTGIGNATLGINNQALVKKRIRHGNGTVEHTTGVIAHIKYHTLEWPVIFFFQIFDGIDKVFSGLRLELGDTQVTETRLEHPRLDALDLDYIPRDGDFKRLIQTFPHNRQFNIRTRLATHDLDGFVQSHTLDRRIIQPNDQVTCLNAGALRRRIINRRYDLYKTVFHADFYTQTTKLAGRANLQLSELLGIQVR